MTLDPAIRGFCAGTDVAVLTTSFDDGRPQTQVTWVDDEHLLVDTEVDRATFRIVERDLRVTVTVWDREHRARDVEVRGGVVEVSGARARDHVEARSRHCTGRDHQPEIQSERAILRLGPDPIVDHR